jgi:MOSC domain-containing protein YiiM
VGGEAGGGEAVTAGEILGSVRSINVGRIRRVEWRDRVWETGILKEPVDGPVRAEGVGLAGDEQADLSVHGGVTKSVYAYPREHYAFWRKTLGRPQTHVLDTPGAFGENLTTEGFLETDVGVGDLLRIGSALLRVTEPRLPCAKLGLRFQDPLMTRRFHSARRNGIYFAIAEPGHLKAGDEVRVDFRHPVRLTIQQIADLETGAPVAEGTRERAASHPALSDSWRARLGSASP